MISDAKEIIERLNGPSDWAIVGGAAVAGLIADGTINVMPFPFFSPGMCALAAAGAALSAKRAFEASAKSWQLRRRSRTLRREAERCLGLISESSATAADDLRWRLELDGSDIDELEEIVRDARALAKSSYMALGLRRDFQRGMTAVFAGGGESLPGK